MHDAEYYERQYNPRVRLPDFATYFERWRSQGAAARRTLRSSLDVSYGDSPSETLDFFPAQSEDAALLIFIHGGYWRAMDKSDFSWIAAPYVAAGAAVAVLNYGLAPAFTIEQMMAQMERACAWLYANAQTLTFDRTRIVCSGHSAGGHLTASLLTTQWKQVNEDMPVAPFAAAVTLSGLFDLTPLVNADFLNRDLKLDPTRARELSPVHRRPFAGAPLLAAVGAHESEEFHRQTELLALAWGDESPITTLDVAGQNHFSICDSFAAPGSELFERTLDLLARRRER